MRKIEMIFRAMSRLEMTKIKKRFEGLHQSGAT